MQQLVKAALVTAAASLVACGGEPPKTELLVGSLVPRTGNNANADWIIAAQLAADEINDGLARADNPKNLAMRWDSRDTVSTPALMRQYARELVGLGAKILTSESSAAAHGNAENYVTEAPLETAMICASCTSTDINKPSYTNKDPLVEAAFRDPGNWLFRTAPNNQNHNNILTRKMGALGQKGDVNGDGYLKIVVICTTDTGCISTQTPADVQASRKAALDTYTANASGSTCNSACANATDCAAACAAAPGCAFNPTVNVCTSDRVLFEYLLVDQYTPTNSAEWAAVMTRVFDGKSQLDTFMLAPGTTSESADKPGTISAQAVSDDPADCKGPDVIWNKSLPVPSLSLVKAYSDGGYAGTHPGTKFMSHDPFHRNFIRVALGAAGNGQEGVAFKPFDFSASGDHFVRAQRERTGNTPTSFEAQYYDAVALAMLATIKAAAHSADPLAVTGAQVRDALLTLNDPAGAAVGTGPAEFARAIDLIYAGTAINYNGASGECDFTAPSATDAGGNIGAGQAVYWRIENAQYSYKELYDCRQNAASCPVTVLAP